MPLVMKADVGEKLWRQAILNFLSKQLDRPTHSPIPYMPPPPPPSVTVQGNFIFKHFLAIVSCKYIVIFLRYGTGRRSWAGKAGEESYPIRQELFCCCMISPLLQICLRKINKIMAPASGSVKKVWFTSWVPYYYQCYGFVTFCVSRIRKNMFRIRIIPLIQYFMKGRIRIQIKIFGFGTLILT
jgi:hypothetical protein